MTFKEESRKQAVALKNAVDCAVGPSFSLKKINVYKNTTTINAEKRYMVKNGRYIL